MPPAGRLVHELGVEPSGETMTLYQRIRDELSDRGPEALKYRGAILSPHPCSQHPCTIYRWGEPGLTRLHGTG